ncbi:MAG: hypothetical protein R3301_13810 [Saprospiraceae bacterium]|nr:hypothetical protein [Saprospiraceae bacterium]
MKKVNVLSSEARNKKTSMRISVGLHTALLVLGLIPLTSSITMDDQDDIVVIPIEFAEFAQSNDEGLQAKSPVPDPEVKPVVEAQEVEPDIVEAEEIQDVAQVTEQVEEVESEIVEETVEEVAASEDNVTSDDTESATEGGSDATLADGDIEGSDVSGADAGQKGLDGDGVITRQIIYRQDISQAALHSGKIVVDLCIDRRGRVLSVANNGEGTTITDMDMVRQALEIATGYRFETDYSAARRECGSLTFIFDIEGGLEFADIAMNE